MKSMHVLLDEAEPRWRVQVSEHFPLRAETPVIRNVDNRNRDWTFSTDLKRIFAHISSKNDLQKKFEDVVSKYWDGEPQELARDVLHYLLHHELYHPLEAPFSVSGFENDNKLIHQAIRRGLLLAEPDLSPLEQIAKVSACQNGVKDFILDNRLYLDNHERAYFRGDVIPVWDLLELQEAKPDTNFYSVTRFLYGVLYGPQSTYEFFKDKAGKKGINIAEKSLNVLINSPVDLSRIELDGSYSDVSLHDRTEGYAHKIREVFSSTERYKGIERLMSILGPFVKNERPNVRPDMQGEGSGSSPQNILQDLLDDMGQEQQEGFLADLGQEELNSLADASSQMQTDHDSTSIPPKDHIDELKNLDVLALHEFYKRNHPDVTILGGKKIGEVAVVGKQEYWKLINVHTVSPEKFAKHAGKLKRLTQKTNKPWFIQLENGMFQILEYQINTRDVKDIRYVDSSLDVPDEVDLYVDSSGSMFGYSAGVFKVNDGSRADMLYHSLYGLVDGLRQADTKLGKQTLLRLHNVADEQIDSVVISLEQFWNGNTKFLTTLFKPENGYDKENLDIQEHDDGLKRAYVVITDGHLVIEGRSDRESRKMKRLAKDANNTVALLEIGGTYCLGEAVKADPNIKYYPVHNKKTLMDAGLEILLGRDINPVGGYQR